MINLVSKDELVDEIYNETIECLKEYAPYTERDLFPYPTDGVEMDEWDLSICLIEDIPLKGKRWIKNHKIFDIEEIKEMIAEKYIYRRYRMGDIYTNIDKRDKDIIDVMLQENYNFRFKDDEYSQKCFDTQLSNANMNSCHIRDMCIVIARRVLNNDWSEVVEYNL